jgi:hypothetical protein
MVDCEHYLYLYRDPIQILKSTVLRRHFSPTILAAIHFCTRVCCTSSPSSSRRTPTGRSAVTDFTKQPTAILKYYERWLMGRISHPRGLGNEQEEGVRCFCYTDLYKAPSPVDEESMMRNISNVDYYDIYMTPLRKLHE